MSDQIIPDGGATATPGAAGGVVPASGSPSPGTAGPLVPPASAGSAAGSPGSVTPAAPAQAPAAPGSVTPASVPPISSLHQNQLDAHEARTDNPHGVTAAQVGAATAAQLGAETAAREAADLLRQPKPQVVASRTALSALTPVKGARYSITDEAGLVVEYRADPAITANPTTNVANWLEVASNTISVTTNIKKQSLTGLAVGVNVRVTGEAHRIERYIGGTGSDEASWVDIVGSYQLIMHPLHYFTGVGVSVDGVLCPINVSTLIRWVRWGEKLPIINTSIANLLYIKMKQIDGVSLIPITLTSVLVSGAMGGGDAGILRMPTIAKVRSITLSTTGN